MINRRVKRPSRSVENLQQFCLNNSAGVDCTTPHNDVKSVYAAKNLVNNPDGSLSLRKPIVLRRQYPKEFVKVFQTGVGNTVAYVYDSGDGTQTFHLSSDVTAYPGIPYDIVWIDNTGVERTVRCGKSGETVTYLKKSVIDFTNAICVHLDSTSIVLGNCMVNLFTDYMTAPDAVVEANLCDKSLYPDLNGAECWRPRYVQIIYNASAVTPTDSGWTLRIVHPEPNEYKVTDTRVFHDTNTLLDNPFMVRDTYNAAVPAVKTIRPYVYSTKTGDRITPASGDEKSYNIHSYALARPSMAYSASYSIPSDGQEFITEFSSYVAYDKTKTYERKLSSLGWWSATMSTDIGVCIYYPLTYTNGKYVLNTNADISVILTVDMHVISSRIDDAKEDGREFWLGDKTGPSKICLKDPYVQIAGYGANSVVLSDYVTLEMDNGNLCVKDESDVEGCARFKFTVSKNTTSHASLVKFYDNGSLSVATTVYVSEPHAIQHKSPITHTPYSDLKVCDLTESTLQTRYRAASAVVPNLQSIVLKAFMAIPKKPTNVYCSWRYSIDGVTWEPVGSDASGYIAVEEPSTAPLSNVDVPKDSETGTKEYRFVPLASTSPIGRDNLCTSRGDCLLLTHSDVAEPKFWNGALFKLKVCALKNIDASSHTAKIAATYSEYTYTLTMSSEFAFEDVDTGNTALGNKRYLNKRMFSFGDPSFKNNIFYTYPGEFITPLTNVISLSSSADDTVTSVSAWRNYIISTTPQAVYLSSPVEDGYFTKTINTAIGVSALDRRCVSAVPAGIVFKSDSKVYILYPNAYASDDTFMNVVDISKQVSHILEEYVCDGDRLPFSFTTSSEYVLMLPTAFKTLTLRYDLEAHRWNVCEYPVVFTDVHINSLNDIRLYGFTRIPSGSFDGIYNTHICEYAYDVDFRTHPDFAKVYSEVIPYCDIVYYAEGDEPSASFADIVAVLQQDPALTTGTLVCSPIEFELDTGQKTDAILTTKQFVETKLVVATLHKFDAFPMQVLIHVDGNPNVITKDISTDAPFWKNDTDVGVLNTNIYGNETFNTLRQLILRYSGKGKSIRHIITGSGLCNFKIYETYVRYKLLNTKQ